MSQIIYGAVNHGKYVDVALGDYTGKAGLRLSREGLELAFMGKQPGVSLPITGKVDGQRATLVRRNKSEIPGMHVFIIEMND